MPLAGKDGSPLIGEAIILNILDRANQDAPARHGKAHHTHPFAAETNSQYRSLYGLCLAGLRERKFPGLGFVRRRDAGSHVTDQPDTIRPT